MHPTAAVGLIRPTPFATILSVCPRFRMAPPRSRSWERPWSRSKVCVGRSSHFDNLSPTFRNGKKRFGAFFRLFIPQFSNSPLASFDGVPQVAVRSVFEASCKLKSAFLTALRPSRIHLRHPVSSPIPLLMNRLPGGVAELLNTLSESLTELRVSTECVLKKVEIHKLLIIKCLNINFSILECLFRGWHTPCD